MHCSTDKCITVPDGQTNKMDGDRREIRKGKSQEKIINNTTFEFMAYCYFHLQETKIFSFCFFSDGEKPGLCSLQLCAHEIYHESRPLPKNEHTLSTTITAIFNPCSKSIPIQSDKNPISCFTTEFLKSFLPVMRHVS